jgi:hypothetical protein
MHAMACNSSGVIGFVISAGILWSFWASWRQRLAFFVLDLAVPMRD